MRYTRHELKQDRFAETAADAMHWTAEHRQKLVNGGIALAVLIIVVAGGLWYARYNETKAADELGQAMLTYQAPIRLANEPADPAVITYASAQERSIAASNMFNKVPSEFGSTKSGKYAKYFAGLCAVDLGNTKVAEDHLKYVAGVRDGEISSMAKLALASLYRNTNRDADAVKLYKELVDHPTVSVPKAMAEMQLADYYTAKQQPAEARKLYEQIAKDNPKSSVAELALSKAQELK